MTAPVSITWWGHATTTIELDGQRILTDPVLTGRIVHLSRIDGPPPTGAALDSAIAADVVLVSHLHLDHLHVPSLRMLPRDVRIVVPRGAGRLLTRTAPELADQIEEVTAGAVVDVGGARVVAVPARHEDRRLPLSRHRGRPLGFIIEGVGPDPVRVWFAGDTGPFPAMADLRPVDVAVVPVGGWGPTLGDGHLDPAQAAEAVRLVGAVDAVPVHYGTFWPTGLRRLPGHTFRRRFLDPGRAFLAELAVTAPCARAHVLRPGQSVTIPGGTP